jgi:hypothetical protein
MKIGWNQSMTLEIAFNGGSLKVFISDHYTRVKGMQHA